jgi:bacterioferritin
LEATSEGANSDVATIDVLTGVFIKFRRIWICTIRRADDCLGQVLLFSIFDRLDRLSGGRYYRFQISPFSLQQRIADRRLMAWTVSRATEQVGVRIFKIETFDVQTTQNLSTEEKCMSQSTPAQSGATLAVTRADLIKLLNEDLAREYQAIIAYVVYSQVLKGAQYMNIAKELEVHAGEELAHAIILANQIDYLGGMPVTVPREVKTSEKAEDMLRFDLDNENETIRNYRLRVRQCEALNEFAMAEQIREILIQEQDHQIALATALGISPPDVSVSK